MLLLPAALIAAKPTRSAVLLHALLSLIPAMAQGADWTFDSVYGATSVLALPGGQASLVRDGAGQQARSLSYTPGDGTTPVSIARAYGPHDRKTIESENGTTRHHLYGPGLAPILRVDSDGGFIYQVGLDTIVVDAAGAATLAHRVTDLKSSTVAVLGAAGQQPGQRVSYASFGGMRLEKTGTDPFTEAVLESAYEGLAVRLLGSDQLVDNRARQYAPASGRFLALDRAGQATAYEARGNNPVSRVDPDGNDYFDRLIAALKQDRSIPIAFGEEHYNQNVGNLFFVFIHALQDAGIPFRVYQEANTLLTTPVSEGINKVHEGRFWFYEPALKKLVADGRLRDLGPKHTIITGQQKEEFHASEKHSLGADKQNSKDYELSLCNFTVWKDTIDAALLYGEKNNEVVIFFFGSAHLLFSSSKLALPTAKIRHGKDKTKYTDETTYIAIDKGEVALIPVDSYSLAEKYGLVAILDEHHKNVIPKNYEAVITAMDRAFNSSPYLNYHIQIWENIFMNHNALVKPFSKEVLAYYDAYMDLINSDDSSEGEGKEEDEKKEEKMDKKKNKHENKDENEEKW